MTGEELVKMFEILDQIWGGVDEGREDGYRFVLGDYPGDVVAQVLTEFAHGVGRSTNDLKWLPKPPEIAARCQKVLRERATQAYHDRLLATISERFQLTEGGAA